MNLENPNKITSKVATFIREKRIAMGLTQQELAELAFNDAGKRAWITRIENGRGISLITVEKIFEALKCNIIIQEN